jgi:hypothetical protein
MSGVFWKKKKKPAKVKEIGEVLSVTRDTHVKVDPETVGSRPLCVTSPVLCAVLCLPVAPDFQSSVGPSSYLPRHNPFHFYLFLLSITRVCWWACRQRGRPCWVARDSQKRS